MTPLETARHYRDVVARTGSISAAAHDIGLSRGHVGNILKLLSLPPGLQDLVEAGRLPFRPFTTQRNAMTGSTSTEAIWTNDTPSDCLGVSR